MYKLVNNEWSSAILDFFQLLRKCLGDRLKMVIGLDEDSYVYDSNVLVVVDKVDDFVREKVAEAAIEVNDKYDCTISYYITSENDSYTINLFSRVSDGKNDCEEAFIDFKNRIKGLVLDVVFANVYDSNVLVVVDKVDDFVREKVAEAAIEVNDKYDCAVSYYIMTREEHEKIRDIIKGS
ncbi:hypothetical protein EWF20_11385 [Sulfolobus sp. S-194]|uniref:hypothetical protein n=1 Tax=Sulfolobus sp. S-194 TaxID=2512240 RepID=UPI00143713FA|nr:hypothetical protein [Sulfolobus sp. S-194]QIW24674.1 hypothetical protein EWF20_11385 [Sulfolobus sp. S-194]